MQLAHKRPSRRTRLVNAATLTTSILSAFAAPLLSTGDAHADDSTPVVSVDFTHDAVDTSDSPSAFAGSPTGRGFDLGLGLRSTGSLWIYTAEISAGFHDFGDPLDPKVTRLLVGSRISLDWAIRPSLYSRFGIGYVSIDPSQPAASKAGSDWAGDVGISLDLPVASRVEVGVSGSLNWVGFDDDSFNWFQAGAHITFPLGG